MHLREIQQQCKNDSEDFFPDVKPSTLFYTLAVAGEVGEFANMLKKKLRGDEVNPTELAFELPDILIYLCDLASSMGVDLEDFYHTKREYNVERFGSHSRDKQPIR